MDAYIGLDVGTTHIKAVVVDENDRVLAKDHQTTPVSHDQYGDVHDHREVLNVCREVVRSVSQALTGQVRIRAICIASVSEEGFFLDRFDHVLAPSVAWYEHRRSAQAQEWMARYGQVMRPRTGLPCKLSYSLFKWLWFKEIHADLWAKVAWWLPISDFIAFELSGEKVISSSHATRTFAFDVYHNGWIAEAVAAALPKGNGNLPQVGLSGQILSTVGPRGREWGLAPETVVVTGGHDHPVGAMGAGVVDSQAILDSMGTAELLYWPQQSLPRWDALPQGLEVGRTNFLIPYYFGAGTYTGMLIKTLTRLFNVSFDKVDDLLKNADASGLMVLPNKLGDRIQFGLRGVTPDSQPGDIIRAAIESSSMVINYAFEMMRHHSPYHVPPQFIVIGGGTNSVRSLAIKASILNQPIYHIQGIESVAMGAARFAQKAVTGDEHHNLHTYQVVEPQPLWVDRYREQYEAFIGLWQKMGEEAL